jgi:hypothetical protein
VAGEIDFYTRVLPPDGSFAVRLHHVATYTSPGEDEWGKIESRAGYVDTTAELGHWLEICQLQPQDIEFFTALVADGA